MLHPLQLTRKPNRNAKDNSTRSTKSKMRLKGRSENLKSVLVNKIKQLGKERKKQEKENRKLKEKSKRQEERRNKLRRPLKRLEGVVVASKQ